MEMTNMSFHLLGQQLPAAHMMADFLGNLINSFITDKLGKSCEPVISYTYMQV